MSEPVPNRANHPNRKTGLTISESKEYTKIAKAYMKHRGYNPYDMESEFGGVYTCPNCSKKTFANLEGSSSDPCCDTCWSKHTPAQKESGCGREWE